MKKYLFTLITSLFLFTSAFAGPQFIVATGGPTGTYSQMFKELTSQCVQPGDQIVEKATSGSVQNVDLLLGNQVNGAIVQEDVLKFRAKTDSSVQLQVKQLFGLHHEEIHLVTRAAGRKVGGWFGGRVGGEQVVLRDFRDLQGHVAGAVGGSYLTAQVFAANSGVNFTVQEFKSNDDALQALQKGDLDVVFMVMGAPADAIKKLDNTYRLLPIEGAPAEKLKDYYDVAHLTYTNLDDSQGVPALSVQSDFVTRDYKTEQMVALLKNFRECFQKSLGTLQETTGTHPKWQDVQVDKNGKWPLYDR